MQIQKSHFMLPVETIKVVVNQNRIVIRLSMSPT